MNEMAITLQSIQVVNLYLCISLYFSEFLYLSYFWTVCSPSERGALVFLQLQTFQLEEKLSSRINKKRWCGETKGTITIMMRIMLMLVSMKLSMITWGGGLRSWTPIFVFPGSSLDYNIIIYFDYITITRSTSSRSEDTLIQVRRSSEMPLSANDIRIRIRRWTLKLWL